MDINQVIYQFQNFKIEFTHNTQRVKGNAIQNTIYILNIGKGCHYRMWSRYDNKFQHIVYKILIK